MRVPHIKVLADLEVGDARFSIDMQDLKDLKNRPLQKKSAAVRDIILKILESWKS